MQWVVLAIPFAVIFLYLKVIDLPRSFKDADADTQKKKLIHIEDRQTLAQILKENIGNIVTIQSKDFTRVYENRLIEDNREITGKILEVDDDWINIEFDSRQFIKKDSLDQLIFRIDRINSFFLNGNSNS